MGKTFDKLHPFYVAYKYRLPNAIKKKVFSLLTCRVTTPLRAKILARIDPPSMFLLMGKEKYTGVNFKSLIIGRKLMAHQLARIIYSGNPAIEEIGPISFYDINLDSTFFPKVDLMLAEINKPFLKRIPKDEFIILPRNVNFVLGLSGSLETFFNRISRRRRRSIRRIKKFGYSYEVTHNEAKFSLFYHKMYYPYIIKRHNELATLESYAYLRQLFKHGGLLLVKENNRYISGILYCLKDETVWTPCMGISEGNDKYLKKAAGEALVYFLILWSKKQGYKKLDYGNCRPFLNDGLLCYKREWRMKTQKNEENVILVKPFNFGRGIKSYFTNNPFITVDDQHINGCVLIDHKSPVTEREVDNLFKQYYISGLSNLYMLSTSGFEQKASSKPPEEVPKSLSNLFKIARESDQDLKFVKIKKGMREI